MAFVTLTWRPFVAGGGGQFVVDWDGTVVLTTPRLLLRTFRRDDLPHYAALNADPEVVRYLGGPLTREDCDDGSSRSPSRRTSAAWR